ncbi:MAG: serine O-acetyltransferase [Lachnospiraceae bacterium]|nr:serine O-acetyltransferase [Lachnospiraceae bacterium]
MNQDTRTAIEAVVQEISENYRTEELLIRKHGRMMPNRATVVEILEELRKILFAGYFQADTMEPQLSDYFVGQSLTEIYGKMKNQIELAMIYMSEAGADEEAISQEAEEICVKFFRRIPYIQKMLLKDVQAGFDGDPAAKSKEDIIFSYPGFFAILVYRIAHELYVQNVPLVPRIMSEYVHGLTGIDINPGATIGEYFFIDHGTGVVIGETTTIGNNVKLYQGVTLGALSTRSGQQLSGVKRHPTIEDRVTIYSGATVLGGDTVIGEESIIGGSAFITHSIPKYTKVAVKNPELTIKAPEPEGKGPQWELV